MKIYSFFFFAFAVVISMDCASQLNYSEYKGEVSINNYSAISYNNSVIGYNVVLRIKNKYESFLSVNFLDKNADEISTVKLDSADNLHIIETAFNGKLFAILMLNGSLNKLQSVIFDMQGHQVMNFEKLLNRLEVQYFTSKISQQASSMGNNKFLHEIDSQGFFLMYNTLEENLYTCSITKIDSNPKAERFYTYMADGPIYDAKFLGRKDKVLYFSFEKTGKSKGSFTADIIGLGVDNFDQQFEINQNEQSNKVFIPECIVEGLEKTNPIIEGRFYFTNLEMINQYHDGIGLWEITPNGTIIQEEYSSFQTDFKDLKFSPENRSSEVGYLFPHKAIGTKDGKIYIISEGYKKIADGSSMMMPVFGYYGSMYSPSDYTKIRTTDIVISEFFPNLKYRSSGVFEKKSNAVELGFYGANSIYRIGDIFNRYGLFDYLFTESVPETNGINVYFRNYNRNYNSAIMMKVTKLSLTKNDISSYTFEKRPNTSETYFLPLNYGNLMIMEYINRKKTMYFDIRIMK